MKKIVKNLKIKKLCFVIGLIAMFLSMMLSISGCGMVKGLFGQSTGEQSQQGQQGEQEEKIPKQIEEMEASIEKVFQKLGGPAMTSDEEGKDQNKGSQGKEQGQEQGKEQEKEQGKEQQSAQGKESEQKQSQGGEESKDQGQKQQSEQKQDDSGQSKDQQADPWQQVNAEIASLHFQWNESMPEITKKGVKKDVIEDFSSSLNNLTKIASDKDKTKTMLAASTLYGNIPEIYALYKTKINPELKSVIYYARDTILYAMTGEWDKAFADVEELKSSWNYFKNTLDEQTQEETTKVDLSISELDKVVDDKDPKLVELKGKIVLKNLETLEKSLEEKQKKSQK